MPSSPRNCTFSGFLSSRLCCETRNSVSWIRCDRRTLRIKYGDVAPTKSERRMAPSNSCVICAVASYISTVLLEAGSRTYECRQNENSRRADFQRR